MEIGYINFSAEERNNIYKVIQSIRDHQAIDELGIGRIRDAFSSKMFPGMSTLQNRAKYFTVLPALFIEAEKKKYKNVEEVRQTVLDLEIKLTRQLMIGSPNADGITGSSVIKQAERSRSRYVKYDPSYIYWGGLVTYGMAATDGNLYRLIYERSLKRRNRPVRLHSNDDDREQGDDDETSGDTPIFNAGGLHYVFDGKTPIPLDLTSEEAGFIKGQILTSGQSKDSLLAYLLKTEEPVVKGWLDNASLWRNLPSEFRRTYTLSAIFSRFIYLLRIFYNYIYDKKTGNVDGANENMDRYKDYLKDNYESCTVGSISTVITSVSDTVTDTAIKSFCLDAASCVEQKDLTGLENCIVRREKETKGPTRAKLTNWKKFVGQAHGDPRLPNYRWSLVYSMIQEIRKGLENG